MIGIIDLDNTCFEWIEWVITQLGEPVEDGFMNGMMSSLWPDKSQKELNKVLYDPKGYGDALPVPGAPDSLRYLIQRGIDIAYVSAAPNDVKTLDLRKNSMRHFGFPLPGEEGVALMRHLDGFTNKSNWIIENQSRYDFSFIIDDSISAIDAAHLAGIPYLYLLTKPWNVGRDGTDHFHRVLGWNHAVERIEKEILGKEKAPN
jgi:hypothetical protein